ncbi:MAG: hypothetical protein AAGC47_15675, partial [Bacteroidota bacterium]
MFRFLLISLLILSFGCSDSHDSSGKSILVVDQLHDHYDNGLKHGKELRTEVRFQIQEWEKGITR